MNSFLVLLLLFFIEIAEGNLTSENNPSKEKKKKSTAKKNKRRRLLINKAQGINPSVSETQGINPSMEEIKEYVENNVRIGLNKIAKKYEENHKEKILNDEYIAIYLRIKEKIKIYKKHKKQYEEGKKEGYLDIIKDIDGTLEMDLKSKRKIEEEISVMKYCLGKTKEDILFSKVLKASDALFDEQEELNMKLKILEATKEYLEELITDGKFVPTKIEKDGIAITIEFKGDEKKSTAEIISTIKINKKEKEFELKKTIKIRDIPHENFAITATEEGSAITAVGGGSAITAVGGGNRKQGIASKIIHLFSMLFHSFLPF